MTRPGMSVRPVRSTTVAPDGSVTLDASPTVAMVPSRMMSVWLARAGAPVPSMTRACARTRTGAEILVKLAGAFAFGGGWATEVRLTPSLDEARDGAELVEAPDARTAAATITTATKPTRLL